MIDDDFELKEIILSASHPAMSYCWIGVMEQKRKRRMVAPSSEEKGLQRNQSG